MKITIAEAHQVFLTAVDDFNGVDPYRAAAAAFYDVPAGAVTPRQREAMKHALYAFIYGKSADYIRKLLEEKETE